MAKKNVHESEELNALLGKRVKVVLFDNTVHWGVLGKSEYSDRYKLDRTEMNIDMGNLCFYKTHIKKVEVLR
jgi:small nuclear ribonucleoprotein (snRNP)-like protein